MSKYDRIGHGYVRTRRPDPHITAAVQAPLAGMTSVVNVGAGAGSYEPVQTMLAVEPSAVMIDQRAPGAAPVTQASAEAIPLRDAAADAAMAVLTVHHWDDLEAGIGELRRIARRRIVVLAPDPAVTARYWLMHDYLPQLASTDPSAAVPLDRLVAALGGAGRTAVTPVPVPHDCTDGFAAAFWRRPEAYLDPAVRAGMSLFANADPDVVTAGLDHLAQDLDSGAWRRRHADLLDLDELDTGLRLLVTDLVPSPDPVVIEVVPPGSRAGRLALREYVSDVASRFYGRPASHAEVDAALLEEIPMTGEPTYIELGVTDADAARTFYGALLGWHPSGSSGPGQVDTPALSVGIHDQDPKAWFEVFFAVDDLDASLAQVTSLGGTVEGEIHVEDGFGRWCECTDDQGVRFGLRQQHT